MCKLDVFWERPQSQYHQAVTCRHPIRASDTPRSKSRTTLETPCQMRDNEGGGATLIVYWSRRSAEGPSSPSPGPCATLCLAPPTPCPLNILNFESGTLATQVVISPSAIQHTWLHLRMRVKLSCPEGSENQEQSYLYNTMQQQITTIW